VGKSQSDHPRALVIRGLTKEYRAGQPVLRGIDLVVPGSGLTAIIGPSGTGKSTLIRCINRLVEPTSGAILFRGQDLAKMSGTALRLARRRIGMVFQEHNLVERLTVMENLLCGRLGYVSVWRAWLRRFPRHESIEHSSSSMSLVSPALRDGGPMHFPAGSDNASASRAPLCRNRTSY
jgi:phosphonate transport system ATP-binding protein